MRPVDKFQKWLNENNSVVDEIRIKHGLTSQKLQYHIDGLKKWLVKWEHSPRSKKSDWKRFLTNNLPKENNGTVRSFSKDRSTTGEQQMP